MTTIMSFSKSGEASPWGKGTVLITGASAGIGEQLARQCAPFAKKIILVARRKDRLDALAAELKKSQSALEIRVMPCDLASLAEVEGLVATLRSELVEVDCLINNAGFGDFAPFHESPWEKNLRMINVNVTALTYLCQQLVPGMVERGYGGVLNISSGVGFHFVPGFAVYVGTKHFVTGFTESLRLDCAGTGVIVTQVCPGPVRSEFADVAGERYTMRVPAWVELSAEECARQSVEGFVRGQAMVVPGLGVRLGMGFSSLFPRSVRRLVLSLTWRWMRERLPSYRRNSA